MTRKDRLPSPHRRTPWREGEQREVIGRCLQNSYEAVSDPDMMALLAKLAKEPGARH